MACTRLMQKTKGSLESWMRCWLVRSSLPPLLTSHTLWHRPLSRIWTTNAFVASGPSSVGGVNNTYMPGFNYYTTPNGGSIGVAYGLNAAGQTYVDNFIHSYASGWRWCQYTLGITFVTPSQVNFCYTLRNPTSNANIAVWNNTVSNMEQNQDVAGPAAVNTFGAPAAVNTFAPA